MINIEKIKTYSTALKLSNFTKNCEAIIHEAQIQTPSYTDFIENILHTEIELRKRRDLEKRMRLAKLPQEHNLNKFDFNYSSGIVKPQLKQLRELLWIDENYNIVVMGSIRNRENVFGIRINI